MTHTRFTILYRRLLGALALVLTAWFLIELILIAPDFSRERAVEALKRLSMPALAFLAAALAAPFAGVKCPETDLHARPVHMPGVRRPRLARGIVFALGVSFLLLGILNGGMRDVFAKAINICTECIGLG